MKRLMGVISFTLLIGTMCVGVAAADTTATASATGNITGGSLSITTVSGSLTFSTTLTGRAVVVSSSTAPTFEVVDATGTGNGWNVAFTATDFSSGAHTLTVSHLKFQPSGGTITVIDGSSGAGAPVEAGGSASVLDPTTGFKVLSAPVDGGMGTYRYTPLASKFTLDVPADTYAGTGESAYSSTLTATVVSGP